MALTTLVAVACGSSDANTGGDDTGGAGTSQAAGQSGAGGTGEGIGTGGAPIAGASASAGSTLSAGAAGSPANAGGAGTDGTSAGAGGGAAAGTNAAGGTNSGEGAAGTAGSAGAGQAGGASCSTPTLHPGKTGKPSLYCPFDKDAQGKSVYCTAPSEHCCAGVTKGSVSACTPAATPCAAGDADWGCEDPATDCGGAAVACCASPTAGKMLEVAPDTTCANVNKLYEFGSSKCSASASCGSGELQLCTSDAQCPTGMTCHAVEAKSNQVGVCQ